MHDNKAEVIGVFIAGAMLGATVALLCAPRSGARTRKAIRRQAGRRLDQLDELQDNFKNQVHEWVEDVTDVIEDGVGRGRKVTVAGRERVLAGIRTGQRLRGKWKEPDRESARGLIISEWTVRGSNPRPRRCERRALPTELTAQVPIEFNDPRQSRGLISVSPSKGPVKSRLKAADAPTPCSAPPNAAPPAPAAKCIPARIVCPSPPWKRNSLALRNSSLSNGVSVPESSGQSRLHSSP